MWSSTRDHSQRRRMSTPPIRTHGARDELLATLAAAEHELWSHGGIRRLQHRRELLAAVIAAGCSLESVADVLGVHPARRSGLESHPDLKDRDRSGMSPCRPRVRGPSSIAWSPRRRDSGETISSTTPSARAWARPPASRVSSSIARQVANRAIYVALGVTCDGERDVLGSSRSPTPISDACTLRSGDCGTTRGGVRAIPGLRP